MGIRFGKYELRTGGFYNLVDEKRDADRKKSKRATDRINQISLSTIAQNMANWKSATNSAESIENPDNSELQLVYKSIEIDAHLFALMQTVTIKVLANAFAIQNDEGKNDEDATKLFKKKWFRKFVGFVVSSKFYGFSAIQLGDIVDGIFEDSELVPREYVLQQKGGIQRNLMDNRDLILFKARPWCNWIIPVGEKWDKGLLHKAAPLVIKKKEVISAWSQAAELFGMPLRIGKTDISSTLNRENMEEMLDQMGSAAWGVFETDDHVEFVEGTKTDFHKIYDEFIGRANSELSKLILLQTGTTDEKSFEGSAKIHNDILSILIESYILFVEEVVNEDLIPLMRFHGLLKDGLTYRAINEQKVSTKELFEMVKELLKTHDISDEWLEETFEIPVEANESKGQPFGAIVDLDSTPEETIEAVSNLYKNYFEHVCG